jgi:hypothetical protein
MRKYQFRRLLVVPVLALLFTPAAFADDADDVLATIHRWASLEGDLDAQASMIRDDRVQIFEMSRFSDQARNLEVQKMQTAARAKAMGGEPQLIVNIESPIVKVYGDVAVASFVRQFQAIPHNSAPLPMTQAFFTMVLVKDGRNWEIAHLHGSTN